MNNKLSPQTVFVLIILGLNMLFLAYSLISQKFSNDLNKFIIYEIIFLTILAFYSHFRPKKQRF